MVGSQNAPWYVHSRSDALGHEYQMMGHPMGEIRVLIKGHNDTSNMIDLRGIGGYLMWHHQRKNRTPTRLSTAMRNIHDIACHQQMQTSWHPAQSYTCTHQESSSHEYEKKNPLPPLSLFELPKLFQRSQHTQAAQPNMWVFIGIHLLGDLLAASTKFCQAHEQTVRSTKMSSNLKALTRWWKCWRQR